MRTQIAAAADSCLVTTERERDEQSIAILGGKKGEAGGGIGLPLRAKPVLGAEIATSVPSIFQSEDSAATADTAQEEDKEAKQQRQHPRDHKIEHCNDPCYSLIAEKEES